MRINVMQGGDMAFNTMAYAPHDQSMLDYFRDSIDYASNAIGNISTSFIDTARNVYDSFNNSDVLNRARMLVSNMGTHINPNAIFSYNDYNSVNQATPYMMEYIMAQPDMWQLNQDQMCDSYDGIYYNSDITADTYSNHTRYQEVMDGAVQYDENGDSYITHYYNTDANELLSSEQFGIRETWNTVVNMLADGRDPSSIDGAQL